MNRTSVDHLKKCANDYQDWYADTGCSLFLMRADEVREVIHMVELFLPRNVQSVMSVQQELPI